MSEKKTDKWFSVGSLSLFFLILAIVCCIWYLASSYIIATYFITGSEALAGQRGDTYGIINSLFASFAFAGLFYTILLQRHELRETRAEFEKQNSTLKSQRFENTFFNLLSILKQIAQEEYFVSVKLR